MHAGFDHTLRFVRAWIPPPPARVLEVGAGGARLALELARLGYRVTAIDRTLARVEEEARRCPDLELIEVDVLDHRGGPYDAILFTRSLHHIHELDRALARAAELLARDGVLVFEEFDLLAPDEETARWYYGPSGTLEQWAHEHEHEDAHPLHTGHAMRRAIESRLRLIHEERGPYLYRALFERNGDAAFDRELQAIAAGKIRPVGLRLVARGRSS